MEAIKSPEKWSEDQFETSALKAFDNEDQDTGESLIAETGTGQART